MDDSDDRPGHTRATHAFLGSPEGVICPRCKRLAVGGFPAWDQCAPRDWVLCARHPLSIMTDDKPFEWVMLYAPIAPIGGSAATWTP